MPLQEMRLGLGTLGLSGKYGAITHGQAEEVLAAVDIARVAYVDSATVYRQNAVDVDLIMSSATAWRAVAVVYKIGADVVDGDVMALMAEFDAALALYGDRLSVAMFHRASVELAKPHAEVARNIRSACPHVKLGVSTNNAAVMACYSRELGTTELQCAVNLLDLVANRALLEQAHVLGMNVQARSCLSTGLLSGKYGPEHLASFTDSNRQRYAQSERNRRVYLDRVGKSKLIKEQFSRWRDKGLVEGSLSQFCLAAIASLPLVDSIVVGGTCREHIAENLAIKALPRACMKMIEHDYASQWAAPNV